MRDRGSKFDVGTPDPGHPNPVEFGTGSDNQEPARWCSPKASTTRSTRLYGVRRVATRYRPPLPLPAAGIKLLVSTGGATTRASRL